ncbi:hypothetical protein [Sphingobium phenoxybenzoativorans]|uniref:hypothetical protein n=1 Tax=Sphingobium phenoxybenzoativorans TaxID=1592790 RepID=UPI000872FAEE|nr:hypothetical protein [Sphingobium phenoxybenzoativorans]
MDEDGLEIVPLARLLSAYGGRDAARHRLIWAFDARLADIVRTTREPVIGQMRLTWWHEVLTDAAQAKGRGDPLVDAWRAAGMAAGKGCLAMIDGWEELIGPDAPDDTALRAFAERRGGGLFSALAGEPDDPSALLQNAGAVWALWDLSGHVTSGATADRAIMLARDYLPATKGLPWPGEWKAQKIALGLARRDILRDRAAPGSLTPGMYFHLVRIALFGR